MSNDKWNEYEELAFLATFKPSEGMSNNEFHSLSEEAQDYVIILTHTYLAQRLSQRLEDTYL